MAIVQFRVDDNLKEQATVIFEKLGIDLSTALRMFLRRCVLSNGIPFSMKLEEKDYDGSKGIEILKQMQQISKENGNSTMTLDEINNEVTKTRVERKSK